MFELLHSFVLISNAYAPVSMTTLLVIRDMPMIMITIDLLKYVTHFFNDYATVGIS